MQRIVVTGTGAICGAGKTPAEILAAVGAGRSAIAPIGQWDASGWPVRARRRGRRLQPARAARRPQAAQAHPAHRRLRHLRRRPGDRSGRASPRIATRSIRTLQARFNDATGVYVGSGGGDYQNQYDFFPLLASANGSLAAFGRELDATVNPMWLLRSLPNNVLCHVGIRHGFKGPNACITNHSVSGSLAIIEAAQALRTGECERAVAVGHDASIEPQMVLYYHGVGFLTEAALRPFDVDRSGSAMGEGAAALVIETERVGGRAWCARARRDPRQRLRGRKRRVAADPRRRRRARAGDRARARGLGLRAADVGMIVAHGNGTRQGDVSEARALRTVFGAATPPVTAFKWAFGHLLAASGIIETVLALAALRARTVPGIAALRQLDPACAGLTVSASEQAPRSDVALVLSRGFGGTNAALVVRATGE